MADDPRDIEAAELALGLLDGEERAAALARVLADPGFAADVERWRVIFGQLFDLWPDATPPEDLIDRIDLSLGGAVVMRRRRLPWPLIATVMTAIAAMLLVVVALRPAPVPPPVQPTAPLPAQPPARPATQPLLVASLGTTDPVSAVFEPATALLRLTGAPAVAATRVAELWVIGSDGTPHALGLLDRGGAELALTPVDARRMSAGATLAISVEPAGGSPKPVPTGPVIATGALRGV